MVVQNRENVSTNYFRKSMNKRLRYKNNAGNKVSFGILTSRERNLRMNHTFEIILHQFKTEISKSVKTQDHSSGLHTVNSKCNQVKKSTIISTSQYLHFIYLRPAEPSDVANMNP